MKGKGVTFRTLDIGGDKLAKSVGEYLADAPNPALGLRAIRYCLSEPQIFLAQLRAILRASPQGHVRLLIPMMAHAHEIEQMLSMVEQAKAQLRSSRHKFNEDIEIGGMIEVLHRGVVCVSFHYCGSSWHGSP